MVTTNTTRLLYAIRTNINKINKMEANIMKRECMFYAVELGMNLEKMKEHD